MATYSKNIQVKSDKAKDRVQQMRDKKKLIDKCVEEKDYKTLKQNGIEFARP